jgi:predicted dehydrogenase
MRKVFEGKGMDMEDFGGQAAGTMFLPDPATWADPQIAGGGYGHAQMSHASGMLFWLTGLRAQSVYCLMTAPGAQVDLYDTMSVRFSSGAIGSFSGAGTAPTDRPYHVDLRIFGTEGMLLLDCERARMELRRHDGHHVVADVAPDSGAYECDGPPHNFIDLILGQAHVNWSPGEAAMRSVELLDAAYRSARSGVVETV